MVGKGSLHVLITLWRIDHCIQCQKHQMSGFMIPMTELCGLTSSDNH